MAKEKFRIGLLIDYAISEYSNLLIEGVQNACKDFDVELLIFVMGELHSLIKPYEYQYLAINALVTKNNLDGIIMTSGTQMHYLSKEELTSYIKSFNPLPVINISVEIPTIPSITVECYKAYKAIIDELIDNQGCKKFCIVGIRGNSMEGKTRTNYIKQILAEKNVPSENIHYLKADFNYASALDELEAYVNEHRDVSFDAIFAMNDEMAFACVDFCRSNGLQVPEDVAIVGFDDLLRDSYSNPTLTTITQDIPTQGYTALLSLREILEDRPATVVKSIEAKAIFRQSTQRKPYKETLKEQPHVLVDVNGEKKNNNVFTATEWYSKRNQLYHITSFYTDMQTGMSTAQLKSRLNRDLMDFGITACAIVIYNPPVEMPTPYDYFNLPHKAEVFTAYDYYTNYDSTKDKKKIKFDPNETLLPEGIIQFSSEGVYLLSLYHNTLQFGYIIYRPGSYDVAIYDLLSKILATILSSSYSFAQVHNEEIKFKKKSTQLNEIARTDELTGLLNRRGLFDLGQTTLKFAKTMNQSGIIVYCDMDGLKKINDTYGHEAGDKAIIAEASILRSNFRSNDVVARIGGDEFAIISPGLNSEAFTRIKNQIEADCEKWEKENDIPYKLSISMGVVPYPSEKDGYTITSLLAEADIRLYEEKHLKKTL